MSSFLDEARAGSQWSARTPCTLGVFLRSLPEAEAADIREAFTDVTVTAMAIGRVIERRYNRTFSDTTLNRHRRGVNGGFGCRCE